MTWLTVLGWLRKVPREVWLALAFAAAVLWLRSHWIGVGEDRCQQAHEVAERDADARAKRTGERAQAKAQAATEALQKETDDAASEVRVLVREVAGDCPLPALPERVHDRLGDAVRRAREAMPDGAGDDS